MRTFSVALLSVFGCGMYSAAVAAAKPGDWKVVGKEGDYKKTKVATADGGKLYSVDSAGGLYVTDLASGTWKMIGEDDWSKTKWMWASGSTLMVVDSNGDMFKVNAADGKWKQIGEQWAWKGLKQGAMLDGALYTVESSGQLFVTDLGAGSGRRSARATGRARASWRRPAASSTPSAATARSTR